MDILPGEYYDNAEWIIEFNKKINIGDRVKIVVDSQFLDYYDGNVLERCLNQIGVIVYIDYGDEWAYKVEFDNGIFNWFKRCHFIKL